MDKGRLHQMVQRKIALDEHIAYLEEQASEAKRERWQLTTMDLPRFLIDNGLREVTTDDGVEVVVSDDVQGNIPKDTDRAGQALRYLRDNGYGDLIKNEVVASFKRGDDEIADRYAQQLVAEGITAERKQNVHPQTLLAWARRALKEGDIIDLSVLGLQQVTLAKVKQKKDD